MKRAFFLSILIFAVYRFNGQTLTINTDLIYKVNLPLKKTDKTPVIILLHGYGSNEEDLFDISRSFDERFITFSLRAPYPAQGKGYSWFAFNFDSGKDYTYDYKQVKESRNKIYSFISQACKTYKADSNQVFILGFSQGAIMAYELALVKPKKLKGIIALSGLMLNETKKINTDYSKTSHLNFFIAHGNMDNVIAYHYGEEATKSLQARKIKVTFKSYEMPHSLTGKELNDIKDWLKSNIAKEKKENVKTN